MIKVRIHLYNPNILLDRSVYIETFLPAVPTKDSCLYLTEDDEISFTKQVTKTLEKAKEYYVWFGNGQSENFSEKDYDDFIISEVMIVNNIFYFTNQDYVSIEIYGNSIKPLML